MCFLMNKESRDTLLTLVDGPTLRPIPIPLFPKRQGKSKRSWSANPSPTLEKSLRVRATDMGSPTPNRQSTSSNNTIPYQDER